MLIFTKIDNQIGWSMRNPKLKYSGLIVALIGGFLLITGLYMGCMPYYNTTVSDYSQQIVIGIILLAIGLLTWIFVFE